jgi:ABC-type sugar transport system ATPase subunit
VTIQSVDKSFSSVKVVRNLDIKAERGEIVGLVGRFGCAKSALCG